MNSSLHCPRCGMYSAPCESNLVACRCKKLSHSAYQRLQRAFWKSCLCQNCLMHLEKLSQQAENVPNAAVGAVLLEGIHYYLENGRWVFTELYHFQRGYCCRSGCRHCIYGFKKSAL